MNAVSPVQPRVQPKTDWGSVAQLAFCGLAFLVFFSLAGIMGLSGISALSDQSASANAPASFSLATGYLLIAGLLALSTGSAFLRILGTRQPAGLDRARQGLDKPLLWLILLWPAVLLVGFFVANIPAISWILLPPLHVLAVSLPVVWLVHYGRRGLPTGSFQRLLGVLSAGMAGSFFLALVSELAAIVVIMVIALVIVAANPSATLQLNFLIQRLMNSNMDPEVVTRALQPYLRNPLVIFGGLAFICGCVPMIEEFFKPLAVWLIGRKLLTPAEGFAVGLLAGGGFALNESLGQVVTSSGSDWMRVEFLRGGTDLLHIVTAGLMGWALVSAWRGGKAWRLGLVYLGVILMHGTWNALALGYGLAPFLSFSPASLPYFQSIGMIAPFGLGMLFVFMFILLFRMNHNLRAGNIERKQNADY